MPTRWIVAATVIGVALIASWTIQESLEVVTVGLCAEACGPRLDYSVRGECSCLAPSDAPEAPPPAPMLGRGH